MPGIRDCSPAVSVACSSEEKKTRATKANVKGRKHEFRFIGRKPKPPMARAPEYYSAQETKKPNKKRIYHDDDKCRVSREIPQREQRYGTVGYRQCEDGIEPYMTTAA